MTTADQAWQALADWQPQKLTDLVGADPEARLQALVRTVADIRKLLLAGADKVSINSAAVANPDFVAEAADKFSQLLAASR